MILLVLILPSFVIFGVQGYEQFLNEDEVVAKVAGRKVTTSEMDNAHRNLVERARAQQPELDASRLDAPEIKRQALDLLVNDYVLMAAANDQKLR
ncbi:MAG TPA: SurA N-terminal domain-containing protein, partial [Burkholderiaceae bacterium]|nr:SurA N-terminal domain-containing protein [Burkholderiaceae bacterium]